MRTTYRWITEYCPFPDGAEALADLLTNTGTNVERVVPTGDDWRLEVEVTSNRTDCLGVIGLAREVSAAAAIPPRLPFADYLSCDEATTSATSVTVEDPDLCPRYAALLLRGVRVGPSPSWLARRLEAIGDARLRPINNVVDVTNFVLLECNQPLHAFDFERLAGRRIVVRRARRGESVEAIDHRRYDLTPADLVIADAERPVCVAGVMGGTATEITGATRDVLLECAYFQPRAIWETSRRLKLASDSSFRFERGIDPAGIPFAARRAARLIQEMAGGEVLAGMIDVCAWRPVERLVEFRPNAFHRHMGFHVAAARQEAILAALGLEKVPGAGRVARFRVPSHRPDLAREVDLIEEVARVVGLDAVPERLQIRVFSPERLPETALETGVARDLAAFGFLETVTDTFTGARGWEALSPWTSVPPHEVNRPVRAEQCALRESLLPSLLLARRRNQDVGENDLRLCEVAHVFLPGDDATTTDERVMAGLLADGDDDREARGVVETLLSARGVPFTREPYAHALFAPGQAALYRAGGGVLAVVGMAASAVACEAAGLRRAPALGELDLDLLSRLVVAAGSGGGFREPSRFPGAERDFSFLLAERTPWAEVERAVRGLGLALVSDVRFDHVYQGKGIGPGRKSLTFKVLFHSSERTLTSEEVDEQARAIVSAVSTRLGGVQR
ncbi:MAG: phenylalanine--tRNA ligase subunit beta [Planctomycetes bacterium]|nr:phenylalanine--tRNA ligase subunit beta [Planctomycetota bacterium]